MGQQCQEEGWRPKRRFRCNLLLRGMQQRLQFRFEAANKNSHHWALSVTANVTDRLIHQRAGDRAGIECGDVFPQFQAGIEHRGGRVFRTNRRRLLTGLLAAVLLLPAVLLFIIAFVLDIVNVKSKEKEKKCA